LLQTTFVLARRESPEAQNHGLLLVLLLEDMYHCYMYHQYMYHRYMYHRYMYHRYMQHRYMQHRSM
jgi:hypothetical protein